MKKIISGLIAIAIIAQSVTALAATGIGDEVATTAAESGGTELISGGNFSSDISSKFSTKLKTHSIEWDSSGGFLHIGGTVDNADYLMYDIDDITLQPGKYVFSFRVRHGQENDSLPGDYYANTSGPNNYREFSAEMNLVNNGYFGISIGTTKMKQIFGGDLYETCGFPYFGHTSYISFCHRETHKEDPNGKMVFDEGTEYGHQLCLAHVKYLARVGSEWRTVKKTFVIDSAVKLKDIKIHTSDNKAVNKMSYDIDDLSLMYYSDVTSAVTEPNYDLDPVEGKAIKKGTATIDGELDPAYLSSLNINMMSAIPTDWADGWNNTANARTYYMYDADYIYLFANVMDDDVIKPDESVMNGDVLLWDESKAAGSSPILNNDLFIWRLSLNGTPDLLKVAVDAYGSRVFGVESHRYEVENDDGTTTTVEPTILSNSGYTKADYENIKYAAKQTDTGYQIEVKVPRKLGSVTTAASKLGITLELRDLSASGSTGSEYFAKAGETYNFPVFFNLSSEDSSGAGYLYGTNISGICSDEVSWELSTDGVLTVSGFGAIPNYASADYVPWNAFMEHINKIVINPGVTFIGSSAFEGAIYAASAEIADTVSYIGKDAFKNCSSLSSIAFNGVEREWNAISKESTWNDGAGACKVTYKAEPSSATSGSCGDGLTWSVADGTLSINGTGAMSDFASGGAPWHDHAANIKNIVIANGATKIGDYAFALCSGVKSISIPASVTSIGKYAFAGCAELASINLSDNLTAIGEGAFENCSALTTVDIPGGVATIGEGAFSGCDALLSITANTASYISADGVLYTKDMATLIHYPAEKADTAFTVPAQVTAIAKEAFKGVAKLQSVVVSENVKAIGSGAFSGCTALASVEIRGAVTEIADDTFAYCANLTSVVLPASVKAIGKNAFVSCYNLENIDLSNVVTIGEKAFFGCGLPADYKHPFIEDFTFGTGLTSVTLSGNLTSIGSQAFANCNNLSDIYFGADRTAWNAVSKGILWAPDCDYTLHIAGAVNGTCGDGVAWEFSGGILTISGTGAMTNYKAGAGSAYYDDSNSSEYGNTADIEGWASWYGYLNDITSVVIESGVTSIGDNAFKDYTALTSVTISDSVTSIGNYAFSGCTSLTAVNGMNSVETLGKGAFKECSALTSINIPETLKVIGGDAFNNCIGLTTFNFPEGITDIGSYAFYNCRGLTVLNLKEGVINIGASAFYGCKNIQTVHLPSSLHNIGGAAFAGCTDLATITYAGTDLRWDTVVKGSQWDYRAGEDTAAGKYEVKDELGSGNCGENLEWQISLNGTLIVSGTGAMIEFASADKAPWYAHRDLIKTVEIKSGVTSISGNAFFGYDITSITVPTSVTTIADTALRGCDSLTTITVDAANTAYASVDGILFTEDMKTLVKYPAGKTGAEYSISADVATIGAYAFEDSANLTVINIPVSVTAIGDYAFANCSKIATINYASVEKNWDKVAKGTDWDNGTGSMAEGGKYTLVTVPNTDIADGTLGENLEWFITNDGVLTISGAGAIGSFESVTTPWAEYSDVIKAVVFGDGITSVGDFAFTNFKNIESVTIGKDVTVIGKHTFINCDKIARIEVDAANANYASVDGVLYSDDMTSLIFYPAGKADTSFTVPTGVTTIISYAVRSAYNLTSVIIPDSVTTIGNYAFWGSENIKTVTIGSGVTAIGAWAFAYCDSLTEINVADENANYTSVAGVLYTEDMNTLVSYPIGKAATTFAVPEGVKRISNYAFYGCDSLVTITLPVSVTTVGNNVFNYCGALTAIEVDADNVKYASENGVLYNKEMTTLIYYPAGKADAEFTVPETVTSIGKSVFEDCDNLETVYVGTNVTTVGYASFAYCDKLANINYAGTEAEWDAVVKGSYWNRYLDGDEVKFGA